MDTLVLNKSYEPASIIPWQDAMTMIFNGRAETVQEDEDRRIHTTTKDYALPVVIRMKTGKRTETRVRFSRQNVFYRDGGCCQYCGVKLTRSQITFDHVLPRSRGGITNWDNIVISCMPCNSRKGNRTPEEAEMRLRKKPSSPKTRAEIQRIMMNPDRIHESWKAWFPDISELYWNVELEP